MQSLFTLFTFSNNKKDLKRDREIFERSQFFVIVNLFIGFCWYYGVSFFNNLYKTVDCLFKVHIFVGQGEPGM